VGITLNVQPDTTAVAGGRVHDLGTHSLLDCYACRSRILDQPEELVQLLRRAAKAGGATVLASHHHRFEPHGVSAICFLAESHISIHTWPELGHATVDVYTCGRAGDSVAACLEIVGELAPERHDLVTVARGARVSVLDTG
jgi:S-adenosylmethionine decarboxylase proenzyme